MDLRLLNIFSLYFLFFFWCCFWCYSAALFYIINHFHFIFITYVTYNNFYCLLKIYAHTYIYVWDSFLFHRAKVLNTKCDVCTCKVSRWEKSSFSGLFYMYRCQQAFKIILTFLVLFLNTSKSSSLQLLVKRKIHADMLNIHPSVLTRTLYCIMQSIVTHSCVVPLTDASNCWCYQQLLLQLVIFMLKM